jgi:deoxyadenosine/deoxycytidine kinase
MPLIAVSGNIGVGKSTFVSYYGKKLHAEILSEPISEYINEYYSNPEKYSFIFQLDVLNKRVANILNADINEYVLTDRFIDEDREFELMRYENGYITPEQHKLYTEVYQNYLKILPKPALTVYLKITPELTLERCRMRDRECEKSIPLEYLQKLHNRYEILMDEKKKNEKVLYVDYSKFEFDITLLYI